ncbi:MAG TPA: glycine hydroxymethyltransferase, partial [Firmicutes bacterium]|nr:glycine hydroxymethyltransferase [Bacillota bacterium]
IFKLVLENTKPEKIATGENAGKQSKAKYILDEKAKIEARSRVKTLLDRFPVYPELDLELLLKYFG